MTKISIIHATYRFDIANEVNKAWLALAKDPGRIEWIYGVDKDEADKANEILRGGIVAVADGNGVVQATNKAALMATGDIIIAMSDDIVPPQDWDAEVEKWMTLKKPAMLFVKDGLRTDSLQTTQIINRQAFYELNGMFFDPCYSQCSGLFADNDLTMRAIREGWRIDAHDLVFKHNHPSQPGNEKLADERWKAHNEAKNYRIGVIHYCDRYMANDWGKVAVTYRTTGGSDPAFLTSWSNLIMRGLRPGDVVLRPSVNMPHSCAANFAVEQFLGTECDSILFIDDDMEFHHDALEKLRTAGGVHDIIMACCPCGRPPFNPVALMIDKDGKASVYENIKGVIVVDTVGLAFTLIHRKVIRSLMAGFNHNTVFTQPMMPLFKWHNRLGEDGTFCSDAKKKGFRVQVAADVKIGHRVTFTLWHNGTTGKTDINFNDFGLRPRQQ